MRPTGNERRSGERVEFTHADTRGMLDPKKRPMDDAAQVDVDGDGVRVERERADRGGGIRPDPR